MRFKLVIFDFDGTLADSFPLFAKHIDAVADRYRFRRPQSGESDALRKMSARELMRHLGVSRWKVPFIANHMRKLARKDIAEVKLFPGIPAVLAALAAGGVKIAIVSSNAAENIEAVLGPENTKHVSEFEGGASLFGKARRFRKIMRRFNTKPEETIYIGDEIRDSDAARAAGIDFGAVGWGYTLPEALKRQRPAQFFDTPGDLAPRLL